MIANGFGFIHLGGGNWPQDCGFPSLPIDTMSAATMNLSPMSTDEKWTFIRSTLYVILSSKLSFLLHSFLPDPLNVIKQENNVSSSH